MTLAIRVSPHQRRAPSTAAIMRTLMLALLPGLLVQSLIFGYGVVIQLLLAVSLAWLFEGLVLRLRGKPLTPLKDNSAAVTAMLLALAIPPMLPWWITAIGVFIAIVMAKQLYGGLGHNPFNPAMVAYAALLVSFPLSMTSWLPAVVDLQQPPGLLDSALLIFTGHSGSGLTLEQVRTTIDGITAATPLDGMRTALSQGLTATESYARGSGSWWGGQHVIWVNLAYLAGGLWLLASGVIRWHIPVAILLTLALCSLTDQWINGDGAPAALFYLLSGATMLGAFFIATDPVSASTTTVGRLWYGAIIGALIFAIRRYGGYPDAIAFAVLLANTCVPVIDHYSRPRTLGHAGGR